MQLRELSRFRYHLTDRIGDCKRKMLSVLDRIFPEYETVFSSVFLASSRRLLQEAASAHEIAEFDLGELTALLRQASGGRFGREKATELQAVARQSTQYSVQCSRHCAERTGSVLASPFLLMRPRSRCAACSGRSNCWRPSAIRSMKPWRT